MSAIVQAAARLLASARGRAVPVRSSYALAPDSSACFAIVPLRMVAEQLVYAVAYGDPDGEPKVVLTAHPLDRDARFLEPFADALDAYLAAMIDAQRLPRLWLPHGAALEVVELLGHRYRTNKSVVPLLQRMGRLCRVLADEATYAGQQLVAVASELLAAHVATGQSPSEDRHLGALLAWIDPPANVPVAEAAFLAALDPAAAMLSRTVDDRIEQLHARVRHGRVAEQIARAEIEQLVHAEALREWRLMARARRAFWSLELRCGDQLDELVQASYRRVAWRIEPADGKSASRGSLAALLDEQVYAQELAEYADTTDDAVARGESLRAGKLIRGQVVERVQPRPGFRPCTVRITTDQHVLRLRRGSELQLDGSNVVGSIEAIATVDGLAVLTILIQRGVRNAALLAPGDTTEWSAPPPADLRIPKRKIYKRMAETQDARVYGAVLPDGTPLHVDTDLLAVARKLRTCW